MSRYSQVDEERLRDQSLVRDWLRSDLLDAEQAAALQPELRVDLRRINTILRAILFLFTGLIIVSSAVLAGVILHFEDEGLFSIVCAIWTVVCLGAAWVMTGRWRLYRCGAEEACAVAAVVFASVGAAFATEFVGTPELPILLAVIVGAVGSFTIYRMFGFRYAALMGVVLTGAVPFALDVSPAVERVLAALILMLIFSISRDRHTRDGGEITGGDYETMQATAWAGLYFVLNQELSWLGIEPVTGWFYWGTYVLVWILPAVGLALGIRDRERPMMDVSAVMALVTLITNKSYLGWTRQTWDPILFGFFLIGTAIAIRRWLAGGVGGERDGFTPIRVLESQEREIASAGMLSVTVPAPTMDIPKSDPGGGRSGGAGASGNF